MRPQELSRILAAVADEALLLFEPQLIDRMRAQLDVGCLPTEIAERLRLEFELGHEIGRFIRSAAYHIAEIEDFVILVRTEF